MENREDNPCTASKISREPPHTQQYTRGTTTENEMLLVAYYGLGWVVVRTVTNQTPEIVSGPHEDHADAVRAAEIRAHRVRQGWAP